MNKSNIEHILVIELSDTEEVVTLTEQPFSIGRHSSNSLVIQSKLISRYHTTIFPLKSAASNDYSYWIVDGDLEKGIRSSNGILVNGQPCLMHELNIKDLIILPDKTKVTYDIVSKDSREKTITSYATANVNLWQEERPTLVRLKAKLADLDHPNLLRLASFTELNPWPIIEIDYSGKIIYANPITTQWFPNIEKISEHPLVQQIVQSCQNNEEEYFSLEIENEHHFFEAHIHNLVENKLIRSYIKHITRRIRAEKMLEYRAYHDELTGLYNRLYFTQRLSQFISDAAVKSRTLAILFIDLDRFKNINDSLGHQFGDLVLQNFALRLKKSVTPDDLVARWGGDEFIVLLTNIENPGEINEITQRIMTNIREAFQLHKYRLYVKASIGIAIYPQDGQNEETLIKHADTALYRTKEKGRNNYQFYTQTMTSKASTFLSLENSLVHALNNQEFMLYYQPQINLKTKKVSSLEALLRWENPQLGVVSPGDFIPLAEEVGLILPIGEWVLREACRQNRKWQKMGFSNLKIAINLSAQQLYQDNFVSMILNILENNELDPSLLELEITETALIENVSQVRKILTDLQSFGIDIALDDFGTGYSSLSYLKQFPFDKLKLDQSFVKHLGEDEQDLAIVSAVMLLGEQFKLRVVAEGVENEKQLNILQGLNCFHIQGYLYSKPLPDVEITQFLTKHF